jgi:hypothetical protein
MVKRTLFGALFVVVILIAVSFTFFVVTNRSKTTSDNSHSTELQTREFLSKEFTFKYSAEDLKPEILTDIDIKDGFVFRAKGNNIDKPILITVRTEDATKSVKAATVLKKDILEMLLDNARKLYPGRYGSFKELSSKNTLIGNKDGREFVFTYKNKEGTVITQYLYLVTNNQKIYYIVFQNIQPNHFQSILQGIINSITFIS